MHDREQLATNIIALPSTTHIASINIIAVTNAIARYHNIINSACFYHCCLHRDIAIVVITIATAIFLYYGYY